MKLWDELVCNILKVPVFVGWLFFILIRNFDFQKGVHCIKQKEIQRAIKTRAASLLNEFKDISGKACLHGIDNNDAFENVGN